jgi:hypothetical protein
MAVAAAGEELRESLISGEQIQGPGGLSTIARVP